MNPYCPSIITGVQRHALHQHPVVFADMHYARRECWAAAPSVGGRVSGLISPVAAFLENMLYRIIPKAHTQSCIVVNVLENCNTTPDHCIPGSSQVKEGVNVFIHVPSQNLSNRLAFPWPPNSRNCITTSKGMTKEQVTLLSFRDSFSDSSYIVRALRFG